MTDSVVYCGKVVGNMFTTTEANTLGREVMRMYRLYHYTFIEVMNLVIGHYDLKLDLRFINFFRDTALINYVNYFLSKI